MYNKPKTEQEILDITKSGRMLADVLNILESTIRPGLRGIDIDELASSELKKLGGIPAFLGYMGFPASICISINDAVVHGIPDSSEFREGDVVGLDFGVDYNGMITDAARTVIIGGNPRNDREAKLVSDTKKALDAAIGQVTAGCRIGDIAYAVQRVLESGKYGIVRDLVGHGVGHHVHEEPEVPNYGERGTGAILVEGMTIAIEPMATLGEWRVVMDPDGWTIRTRDGSRSAHFEDTVLVTRNGCVILTR